MMKSNTIRLANSFALATTILWTLCSAVVWLLPGFSLQVTTWWMHGLDLSVIGNWNLTLGSFLPGAITAALSAWAAGWVLGWSWETLGNKK